MRACVYACVCVSVHVYVHGFSFRVSEDTLLLAHLAYLTSSSYPKLTLTLAIQLATDATPAKVPMAATSGWWIILGAGSHTHTHTHTHTHRHTP